MNDVYRISILRVFDQGEESSLDNDGGDYCKVKFNGEVYVICGNREYFLNCMKANNVYINVQIENDINELVTELVIKVSNQILNPMSTAFMYEEIFEYTGIAQSMLAKKVGKTQGAISNKLRLLKLPFFIQREIIKENLKERHGRAILKLANEERYEEFARKLTTKVIEQKMRVSDLEAEVNLILGKEVKPKENDRGLKPLPDKNLLKNREAVIASNSLYSDAEQSIEQIKRVLPRVQIEIEEGLDDKDYVLKLVIKGIDKEK